MSNPYLAAFNNQFLEFVDDVLILFPNDTDLLVCKKTLLLAKKMYLNYLCYIHNLFV